MDDDTIHRTESQETVKINYDDDIDIGTLTPPNNSLSNFDNLMGTLDLSKTRKFQISHTAILFGDKKKEQNFINNSTPPTEKGHGIIQDKIFKNDEKQNTTSNIKKNSLLYEEFSTSSTSVRPKKLNNSDEKINYDKKRKRYTRNTSSKKLKITSYITDKNLMNSKQIKNIKDNINQNISEIENILTKIKMELFYWSMSQ